MYHTLSVVVVDSVSHVIDAHLPLITSYLENLSVHVLGRYFDLLRTVRLTTPSQIAFYECKYFYR